MYYTKLISLLPLFFYLSSCEVTEEKKSKLLSDFINDPNVGHGASDGILRSVNVIDEHASGDDETQEDVKFQRNAETKIVKENKASEVQIHQLELGRDSHNYRSKRFVTGGLIEQDPNDPIYIQLAEESLQKYVSESVDQKPHKLLGVDKVTTQLVSGSMIRIDFVAVYNDNDWLRRKNCHSKIWEQPWLNKKEINVSCVIDKIHRLKRHVQSGLIKQDPNDPIYIQLAEESLRKYVSESVDQKPHILLGVDKVTTEVVAGLNTRIDFRAAPNDNLYYVKKCHSEIFEQRWVNKKEIKVSCEIDNHRLKRQVPGGRTKQDPNDPIYIQLAEESLQKYVSESVDQKPHKLLGVDKVTTQVVAGLITRIDFLAAPYDNLYYVKKCHSEIFEQPWVNKKEIKVSCEVDNHRLKRQVPGGWTEKNPNDPIYIQLAEESLRKYVSESVDQNSHKLLGVDKVTTQVVAGFNTRIDFWAAPNDNLYYVKKCHSEIFEQPWVNKKEIKVSCEIDNHRLKRQVPGGRTKQDPNDPIYIQLAEESLRKYVSESVDQKPHILFGVDKVTTQVVAGLITRIDFLAAPNDNLNYVKKCHSEIFEQRWVNKKEIKVSCEVDNHRLKRQVPGGWTEKNPSDPIYIQLAEESLRKYVSESVDQKPYKLLGVDKVTTQVVAGFNTRIDFWAAPNDNLYYVKKCHSEIFEQPWVNKKEIKVSCEIDNHRLKGQITGGLTKQDPNDPIYIQLAEESLRKYVSESVDQKPHKLLGVDKVTTQLVAGLITRIDFLAAPYDNLYYVKKCHSEIFEQRWVNKKEIKVSCAYAWRK